MNKLEVLQSLEVEGNVVKMTREQLDRNVYLEVKKALELIGGKWKGGKTWGFVFQTDPTELLTELQGGGSRNLKKEYQYFATPDDLADDLVRYADIEEHHTILEPSAGQGAIVNAINRFLPNKEVHCYEAMPTNQIILKKIPTVKFMGDDVLEPSDLFVDRVIANPPFSKNQDIMHVLEMESRLNEGGRLVSIMSKHWQTSSNSKERSFREWLDEQDSMVIEVAPGTFKESGTGVGSCIVVIDK